MALDDSALGDAPGAPADLVTPAFVRDVFGVDCEVVPDPQTGAPLVMPSGLARPLSEIEAEPVEA